MKIEDSFRVEVPVEEAWKVLLDLERIAPCLPGAQLTEVEGDEYRGTVKIKVGPITAQYKGVAKITEADDTDLNITGKVAQFGRGVMADVSSKLLGQFADNLKKDVLSGGAAEEAPTDPAPAVTAPTNGTASGTGSPADEG